MQRILLLVLVGIFLLNGCKKEEDTPVTPSEYGTIKGVIIEEGTNYLLANVNVFSVPSSSFVTTNANGAYTISNVTPGEYEMYAYKNTYDTSNVSITVTADATTIADFTLRVSDPDKYNKTGTLTGTIRNKKDNLPIAKVSIRTLPVTSVISTDANGVFTLENVDPGLYQVFAEKENFDTTYTNVTVVVGKTTVADFYLSEQDSSRYNTTGTITGTVRDKKDNLPIATVSIRTLPVTSVISTDANGVFTLENVNPGEYQVFAEKEHFDTTFTNVTVVVGKTTVADFYLSEQDSSRYKTTGTITGTVRDKKDNLPIATVSIRTLPVTSVISTDANGVFTLENVNPGEYQVFAEKENFDTTSTNVTVIVGKTTMADFYLSKQDTTTPVTTGTASGIIKDAITGNLISGAIITTDPSTGSVLSSNIGEYKLQNLSPGEYTLNVVKSGYELATTSITIIAGLNTIADVVLTPTTGQVNGVIKNAISGSPIPGVNVTTNPGSSSVTSASDGTYMLTKLPAGTYTIITLKDGYISGSLDVVVNPGVSTIADIALQPETSSGN